MGCWMGGAASAWGTAGRGRLMPRQSPAPTPPGPPVPLATPWPREAAAGPLAHGRGQLGPAAAPGPACCRPGLPAQRPTLPVRGRRGRGARRRAGEGLRASPGPGPRVHAWVGLPAHSESPCSDKPRCHPQEPGHTLGNHQGRFSHGRCPLPGLAVTPIGPCEVLLPPPRWPEKPVLCLLARPLPWVPICKGAWHRRPPAGSCPLCGPVTLA